MTRIRRLVCLIFLAAVSTAANAHQEKAAVTVVLFNDRTGNLEVMHRVVLHDAEHAAEDMWGHADILQDEAQRKRFADYVRSRFQLRDENDAPITLTPVGHEIDGPFLWVYHEAPAPEGASKLVVEDAILRDFWADQYNLVNIERGDFRGSLSFHGGAGAKEITLDLSRQLDKLQSADQP